MIIDELAKALAVKYGMPPDLHVPIAARNVDAINTYIGQATEISNRAFIVDTNHTPSPNVKLPVWKVKGVEILHCQKQLWVHVNNNYYRKAYMKAFPEENLGDLVIDHIMNRRLARIRGFEYIRVVPISRAANSSSGNVTEKYAIDYHSSPNMMEANNRRQPYIYYADTADIVKMLDIKPGGKIQDGINEALYYFCEE